MSGTTTVVVNGVSHELPEGETLLDALRGALGDQSVKDGCSPQGQCGCCTVWVDGEPRVACVTPVRRVAGRSVTTLAGLDPDAAGEWGERLCSSGGSQCGFCTGGIVMRLEALRLRHGPDRPGGELDADEVQRALAAHLCRCTGWQTIVEAATGRSPSQSRRPSSDGGMRSLEAATLRASIEGRTDQMVDPTVALGWPGFGDDRAPAGALVAMRAGDGSWVVDETPGLVRRRIGKVQGRRSTTAASPPIEVPEGDWDVRLATSWVEPAYLESDATWCEPGGQASDPLANGGAFGAKRSARELQGEARRLADLHRRPVRVLWSREDVVRYGVKRPPLAAGLRADGSGLVRVARTAGIVERIAVYLPRAEIEEVDAVGPPTSAEVRAGGWAEAAVLAGALRGEPGVVSDPDGAWAQVVIREDSTFEVSVRCGEVLDAVVLRSYCIGAVHQALGWVVSEGISVDELGRPTDLTIRSFGIIRPAAMPHVTVTILDDDGPPVCGSDAVFAATASAVWHRVGYPPSWPSPGSWA